MAVAIIAVASCGQTRAAPAPTIEYRTPVSMTTVVPNPPACPCETPTVITTPTPIETLIPIATPAPETASSQSVAQVGTVRPTSAQYAGECGDYPDAVTRWWPVITQYPWDACEVLYIINRESGGENVYNYEGSGACGLMQLLPCEYPDDGAMNIAAGYAKYQAALAAWGDGWHPWAVD